MELRDRLKIARKKAGFTQKDVEKHIKNMKQSTYSELERGISKSTSCIVALANLFDVSVEWLASGIGNMSTSAPFEGYMIVGSDDDVTNNNYIMIDQYDVVGSCGNGAMIGDVTVKGGVAFR